MGFVRRNNLRIKICNSWVIPYIESTKYDVRIKEKSALKTCGSVDMFQFAVHVFTKTYTTANCHVFSAACCGEEFGI